MQYAKRRGFTNIDLDASEYKPQDLLRIARLAREIRLMDQILVIGMDTVSVMPNGPAPAWTTLQGDHISFNMQKMPMPYGKVDIAIWLGTNAHELGHVLYSPREDSPLMQWIIQQDKLFMPGLAKLHNIVEDQREERLMLGRFNPWNPYLVAALSFHLKVKSGGAWLLLTGRTWLSDKVRGDARDAFIKERGLSAADEVRDLVGQYQRLTDPGDSQMAEASDILTRLHTLFDTNIPTGGCGGGTISDGEPDTSIPNEDDLPPAADDMPDADGDDSDNGEPIGGDGNGDDISDDEDNSSDNGNDGDGSGETDKPGGDDYSDPKGGGAGKGGEPPKSPFDPKKASEQMRRDALDSLNKNPESKSDIDTIMDTLINGRPDFGDIEGDAPEGEIVEVNDAARQLRRRVSDALTEFQEETEPGWIKGTSTGRLNVRRLINPRRDPETMFDKFAPGQMDATEMDAVILLDVSGSMTSQMRQLSEATWAIHHAINDIDGKATIITFSSGMRVVATPGKRPSNKMFRLRQWGGTDPEASLRHAYSYLSASQATNRLVVILTDGDWSGDYYGNSKADELIKAMRETGITTVLAFLPTDQISKPKAHGCEYFKVIKEPRDFAVMFRDVALAEFK